MTLPNYIWLIFLALVILIAPARSQGQAGQVAEIQKRLDQARAEEAAAQAGFSKGELKFSDFEAASNKRAAVEAELAKAKAPPVTAQAGQVAEIQKRLDQARAEEAAAQADFSNGESKFSDFEAASKKRAAVEAELAKAKATPLPKADGEVIVPSIPAGLTVAEAKATLSAAGLSAGFNAKGGKPDSENLEFKTSGAQDPPGGSKRKRGATVTVSIYQKYEPKTSPTPTPTPTPTPSTPTPTATSAPTASPSPAISPTQKTTGIPNLIGLTLEQAVARLPAKMEILSDEIGDKPPTPEKALTIFAQTPAAGTTFDPTKPPSVKVKRYGSAKSADGTTAAAGPFVGTWYGKSFYTRENDPPVTMFIRRDPDGSLSIWVEGRSGGYPLETDGVTKLWHKYGLTEITYELAGNTLRGTSRSTDWQGKSVIRNTTLQRK